jgi:hypothetical protein
MSHTPSDDEGLREVELSTKQCAEIALYMYEQWQEAMKPPLFIYKDYPTWLKQLATLPAQLEESK